MIRALEYLAALCFGCAAWFWLLERYDARRVQRIRAERRRRDAALLDARLDTANRDQQPSTAPFDAAYADLIRAYYSPACEDHQ